MAGKTAAGLPAERLTIASQVTEKNGGVHMFTLVAAAIGVILRTEPLLLSSSEATNTWFFEGDAFFPGTVFSKDWHSPKGRKDLPQFRFFRNVRYTLGCGYSGYGGLRVVDLPKSLEDFVEWALARPTSRASLVETPGIPSTPVSLAYFLICPHGYDPNKHGFFMRYNEGSKAGEGNGSGRHLPPEVSKQFSQFAKDVPPLRVTIQGSKWDAPYGKPSWVTLEKADEADFYFLEGYGSQSNPADYAKGKSGLTVYRWRKGVVTRLWHNGTSWREMGIETIGSAEKQDAVVLPLPILPATETTR